MRNRRSDLQGSVIAIEPEARNEAYRSVVSDVISLIEHVQASLRLIEQEIARETASDSEETSANVIVLDDVTPPYVRATAALNACDANLAIALHSLLDSKTFSGTSEHDTGDYAWSPPTRSILSA